MAFFSSSVDYLENITVNIFQRASCFLGAQQETDYKRTHFSENKCYLSCLGDQNY